ncbi:MAG: Uma2 family endonuclease [Burkholderiales bacterium]
MSAVFTPTPARISLERFHKMAEAGIFGEDDRIELIEGEMLTMAPIGGPHMSMVNRLNVLLVQALGNRGVVSVQNPVALPPASEPQPDVVILGPSAAALSAGVPGPPDVLLAIEVADSTLRYDREVKMPLYARHGIREAWIVDLQAKRIEVYREPSSSGYARRRDIGPNGSVTLQALPEVSVEWNRVFA